MSLTIANRITIIRILNVPVFVMLLLYYKAGLRAGAPNEVFRLGAVAVFILTLSLDVIDGFIARKRNEITKVGAVLDPLADKSLLVSAFIMLSGNAGTLFQPYFPMWFVILVISRDIVLVTGALLIHFLAGTVQVRPRFFGKVTTFFQTIVVAFLLFKLDGLVLTAAIFITAFFTLLSAVQYFIDGLHQIERA